MRRGLPNERAHVDCRVLDGEHDDVPEAAFYMVGTIEEALEKEANFTDQDGGATSESILQFFNQIS